MNVRDDLITPAAVKHAVRAHFGALIPLDPATTAANPMEAERFFTEADDGLAQSWAGRGAFVSPPGGRALKPWVEKIGLEAATELEIVALLPAGAHFGNLYWQEALLTERLQAICWIRKLLKFTDSSGARASYPYASCLLGLNVDPGEFERSFRSLGRVVRLTRLGATA